MQNTVQDFLATATQRAADDIKAAYMALPENKRHWSASETARPAVDLIAECAVLNGISADMVESRSAPHFNLEDLARTKAELAKDLDRLYELLRENTIRVVAAIRTLPDEALNIIIEVPEPWGKVPIGVAMSYPYWNMSYHLGQINYIASLQKETE